MVRKADRMDHLFNYEFCREDSNARSVLIELRKDAQSETTVSQRLAVLAPISAGASRLILSRTAASDNVEAISGHAVRSRLNRAQRF
jgi:hypothetical protein